MLVFSVRQFEKIKIDNLKLTFVESHPTVEFTSYTSENKAKPE